MLRVSFTGTLADRKPRRVRLRDPKSPGQHHSRSLHSPGSKNQGPDIGPKEQSSYYEAPTIGSSHLMLWYLVALEARNFELDPPLTSEEKVKENQHKSFSIVMFQLFGVHCRVGKKILSRHLLPAGRVVDLERGKTLGGSSTINYNMRLDAGIQR